MKLFIWNDPYQVRYGQSLLIVAAESLERARELAKAAPNGQWIHEKPGVDVDKIEPSAVLDLPVARCWEWSE